jgi:hypothetical protein
MKPWKGLREGGLYKFEIVNEILESIGQSEVGQMLVILIFVGLITLMVAD